MARAGVSAVPTEGVDLQLVSRVKEQSTVGAAPALPLEQRGQSRTDCWVLAPSLTPLPPIPIVRTPCACDLRVPQTGGVTMGGKVGLTRAGGRRGKHLAEVPAVPVPLR